MLVYFLKVWLVSSVDEESKCYSVIFDIWSKLAFRFFQKVKKQ